MNYPMEIIHNFCMPPFLACVKEIFLCMCKDKHIVPFSGNLFCKTNDLMKRMKSFDGKCLFSSL